MKLDWRTEFSEEEKKETEFLEETKMREVEGVYRGLN